MRYSTRLLLAATIASSFTAAALPGSAAAFTDSELKCRTAIAKSGGKYTKTVLKALTGCHKERDREGPDSLDCNSTATGDLNMKIPDAGTKFTGTVADKCPSGTPDEILYEDCPAPCDDDVPTITDFPSLVSCLTCLARETAEDYSEEANGSPNAPITNDTRLKCHGSVTKNGSKLLNTVVKTVAKCQAGLEKDGAEVVDSCVNADFDALVQDAYDKTVARIQVDCEGLILPAESFDACGGAATVFDLAVCVGLEAKENGRFLVTQLLNLPGGEPTTTTSTSTTTSTTTTVTDTTTTTMGGGGGTSHPQCPSLGELILYSKASNEVCADNNDCTFPRTCNPTTLRCQTVADLDSGWNGAGHDSDINDQVKAMADLVCPGPPSPGCGECEVAGLNAGAGNCRCANNVLTKCDEPLANDADDCGGALCECYFGAPFPLAAQGTPVCVSNRFSQDITGTANPDLGAGEITASLRAQVFLGYTTDMPCPVCGGKCSNDNTACIFDSDCTGGATCVQDAPGDGIRNGECVRDPDFHTGSGVACDVDGLNASFPGVIGDDTPGQGGAGYSIDCQPDVGKNVTGAGLRIELVQTTGTTTLDFGLDCDAGGAGTDLCPCMVCSSDQSAPCDSNADCGALPGSCAGATSGGGVTCTVNADCTSANIGPCNNLNRCAKKTAQTCSNNNDCLNQNVGPCNLQTCTANGNGENPQPNFCVDDICTDKGGGEGECDAGPEFKFCDALLTADGRGINACSSDAACQVGNDYGTCTLLDKADCFLDPIVATGVADPEFPIAGAVFCIPPTSNGGVNDSAGLPGPGRVISQGAATTYCASDTNVAYSPGGVPACPP